MDLATAASVVGDVLAAAAVVLATVELRRSDNRAEQSRRDMLRDRQIGFQLEQLVALSEALDEFGANAPARVRLRVRLLPTGLVPAAEQWGQAQDPQATALFRNDFSRDLDEALRSGAPGLAWGDWIRDRVRREIDLAVDGLLDAR